jgi:thioredoxin-related protein
MRQLFVICFILMLGTFSLYAQQPAVYDVTIDGMKQIDEALKTAKADNQHVFIQVGGNWCPWCIRFHDFIKSEAQVDSMLKSSYVVIFLNYSKENKNEAALARLGYPQRFGFPVFVILDASGNRLHTQDSGFLELDKGYDPKKVMTFLKCWTSAAVNPETYKKKE